MWDVENSQCKQQRSGGVGLCLALFKLKRGGALSPVQETGNSLMAGQGTCSLTEIFIKMLQAVYPLPVSRTGGRGGVGAEVRCY